MAMLDKKGYLKTLKNAIKGNDKHPRMNGVKMQAHHLISAKGVEEAGKSDELRHLEYDINDKLNLVFIPCTLQGACHLEVQLHRGDHKKNDTIYNYGQDSKDDDKSHPKSYHRKVEDLVKNLFLLGDPCKMKRNELQDEMNKISGVLCKMISDTKVHLTSISRSFKSDGKHGCMDIDGVPDSDKKDYKEIRSKTCSVHRDHYMKQAPGQKIENIKFPKQNYTLGPGK